MFLLQCDKCKQKQAASPSRNGMTCNLHSLNEKTGYCQGTLRPIGDMATGSYVAPAATAITKRGTQIGYENR